MCLNPPDKFQRIRELVKLDNKQLCSCIPNDLGDCPVCQLNDEAPYYLPMLLAALDQARVAFNELGEPVFFRTDAKVENLKSFIHNDHKKARQALKDIWGCDD